MKTHMIVGISLAAVGAVGCARKSADATGGATPIEEPAPSAKAADAPAAPAVHTGAPTLFGDGRVEVGNGAGELALVQRGEVVEMVFAIDGQRRVLASATAEDTSEYAIIQWNVDRYVVERTRAGNGFRTKVWELTWSPGTRTLVAGRTAQAMPGEAFRDWVPPPIADLHAGTTALAPGEQLCEPYSSKVTNRLTLGEGTEIMLVCFPKAESAELIAVDGDQRVTLVELALDAQHGLVRTPDDNALVVERNTASGALRLFDVWWDGANGAQSKPRSQAPAYARALLPR